MFRRPLLALLITVLSACEPSSGAKPPRWTAVSSDGRHLHLVASVHVSRQPVAVPEDVRSALGKCKTLVVEAEQPTASERADIGKLMLATDDNGVHRLPPDVARDVTDIASSLGVEESALARLKIWAISTSLLATASASYGFRAEHGFDRALIKHAQGAAATVVPLETVYEQLTILDSRPLEDQIASLRSLLARIRTRESGTRLDSLLEAWREGDAERLARLSRQYSMNESETSRLDDKLLRDRNLRWGKKLQSLRLPNGCAVVAVGFAHLTGEGSLVEVLGANGWSVKRANAFESD